MVSVMKNNSLLLVLPIILLLDLVIPILIAPFYKGYSHLYQVMSVLGTDKSPLHLLYNIWLVLLGCMLLFINFTIYRVVAKQSTTLAIVLCVAIVMYTFGGCILSGLFSVGETKAMDTLPQKLHGYGSAIGFMMLTLAPLCIALYAIKIGRIDFAIGSFLCFIFAVGFFVVFIMADNPNYHNTIISYEGLWQRLSLLFMYLPIGYLYFI